MLSCTAPALHLSASLPCLLLLLSPLHVLWFTQHYDVFYQLYRREISVPVSVRSLAVVGAAVKLL
jgi:hypothetical protein